MASTYVNDLRLNEMATGDASGSWGTVTNTNLELIGEAFSYGTETIGDADSTLTIADGAADAARSFYLKITSSVDLTTTRIVTLAPNTVSKVWMIENATTGSQVITIKQGSGATINVPNGQVKMISTDGAGSGGAVLDLLVDVDLTGTTTLVNLDVSGTLGVTGVLTATSLDISGDIDVDGTTNLDVVDIDGATQIDATVTVGVDDTGYDVKFFGATTGKSLLWDESADSLIVTGTTTLVGTTNLDAVDIDGATQIDATVTVGVDDTGYDVKFFGDTASAYMLWDASADDLILGGAAGLSVNSAALVTGVLTTTAATVSNGGGQFNGAINVGVDDTGYDVKFFGATAGKYMLWDESADTLEVSGTVVADGLTVDASAEAILSLNGYTASQNTEVQLVAVREDVSTSKSILDIKTNNGTSLVKRARFDWDGDISFYAADGTTPSFVYDESAGLTINEAGAARDFRVESATTANALFVEGSSGNVGIGESNPASPLDIHVATDINMEVDSNASVLRISAVNDARSTNPAMSFQALSYDFRGAGGIGTRAVIDSSGGLITTPAAGGHAVFNEGGVDADFRVASDSVAYMLFVDGGANVVCVGTSDISVAGNSPSGSGINLNANGYIEAAVYQDTVAYFNRMNNDGTIIAFLQNGTTEGNISVAGTTVSYNGGHLARWSQLADNTRDDTLLKGTVLTNLDQMAVWGDEDNEQLNCMAKSSVEGDANVAGVFVNWDNDDKTYSADMNIAMTGDMIIRIAQGTTVARGDLLMSAGDGTAKPQGDDIVRGKTIAKITSTHVTCTYDDGSYCVPCVLMAC
jgi:hypothetical protein